MTDGTDVCKGVINPTFAASFTDTANIMYYPSVNPQNNVAFGSVLLYSNKDEYDTFLMQARSDATEGVIESNITYTDGYAIRLELNFPSNQLDMGEYVGACISSQLKGQSCFAVTPRSGTSQDNMQIFVEDIASYYNQADSILLSTRIEAMPKKTTSANSCQVKGFDTQWACAKEISASAADSTALLKSSGNFKVVCNRFLPEVTKKNGSTQTGSQVADYRFAPFSKYNDYFSPLTVWTYSSFSNDGSDAKPFYVQHALTNLKEASTLFVGQAAAGLLAVYSLF